MNLEEMKKVLKEYYEEGGYDDNYESIIEGKSEDEIRELYENIIESESQDASDIEANEYDDNEDELQFPEED